VGVSHIRPSYVVRATGERIHEDRSLIFGTKSPFNSIYEASFDDFNHLNLVFEFNGKNGYNKKVELLDFALSLYNEDTLIITGGSKVPVTEMLKFSLEPQADGKSTLKCDMLGLPHLKTKRYNH
jgi:hypothetical protein